MTLHPTRSGPSTESARWDITVTRQRAVVLARWVSAGSFGLLACIWIGIYLSTSSVRDAAINQAVTAVRDLSAGFAEQVADRMDSIAGAMALAERELRADPNHFQIDAWARDLPVLASPTIFVSYLDPRGHVVSSTARAGTRGLDLSDQEAVNVHMAAEDPGLYVGAPLNDRTSGRWVIHVSKRITDEAGKTMGILLLGLMPEELTHLHSIVDLGPHGVIALIGADGRLRARYGPTQDAAALAPGDKWPLLLDGEDDQTIMRSSAVDGVPRIYSLRRLEAYPLTVAVGLDVDDELANARMHALWVLAAGFIASLLMAGLSALLAREIHRRDQRETALAREHEALEATRAELIIEQGKLANVNRELVVSTEKAESANRAKSQFLAHMSHELRTPLHAVIGFSELIAHHVGPLPSGAQIAEYANDIQKSGRHLLELINSILDLSKVEAGSATVTEDILSLAEPIQDSLTTVREQAVASGVVLESRLPATLPWVRGDKTKLRQIFINLLSNAVKFTPAGGVVAASGRPGPDGGFTISIADTGIGMTEAELAIAMEPFGQVENSLSRTYAGTGLGLPLASRMTEMHGGTLTVHSVKGGGTTVEVWLPPNRILGDAAPAPLLAADPVRLD